MAFTGFGAQALPFFKALAFHPSKDWFEANRAIYESDIRQPLGDLVEDWSAALAGAGIPLEGDRKSSLFRPLLPLAGEGARQRRADEGVPRSGVPPPTPSSVMLRMPPSPARGRRGGARRGAYARLA